MTTSFEATFTSFDVLTVNDNFVAFALKRLIFDIFSIEFELILRSFEIKLLLYYLSLIIYPSTILIAELGGEF